MKYLQRLALAGLCVVLGGCAAPLALNYAPSSTMTVKGVEKVGDFEYMPAKNGKVTPNEIHNTAAGHVYFEKPIAEYFHNALFVESRFVGIDTGGTYPLLHGSIDEFLIDDLGFSIDWTLNVTYVLDNADGSVCYHKQQKHSRHTSKFTPGAGFAILNEVMKSNIELLFKDPEFVACIAPTHAIVTPSTGSDSAASQ
ncbi:MAG: hypothetical protein GAK28_02635 [Luteibacter sp.]|uniref:hypothetical protein n=1 Tax=Luteibacter sp. TaxID=1886636 RepID=UPI00137C6199|nr:hypothetical protein [Luteibacter sp.]KAF1006324.1 MAG: hypothetical protein GAK28_02635 [Luteibacter sp.]